MRRKVKGRRKNPWMTKEVQKVGWHGSLRLPFGYRNLQSSPPMLPRFFSRVRVAKWLKRSSKRRPNPFYILQDLPPKDIFNAAKFPDLSHPRSSVVFKSSMAFSVWASRSSAGVHARAWGLTLERGVARSSVYLFQILELSERATLEHGAARSSVGLRILFLHPFFLLAMALHTFNSKDQIISDNVPEDMWIQC